MSLDELRFEWTVLHEEIWNDLRHAVCALTLHFTRCYTETWTALDLVLIKAVLLDSLHFTVNCPPNTIHIAYGDRDTPGHLYHELSLQTMLRKHLFVKCIISRTLSRKQKAIHPPTRPPISECFGANFIGHSGNTFGKNINICGGYSNTKQDWLGIYGWT